MLLDFSFLWKHGSDTMRSLEKRESFLNVDLTERQAILVNSSMIDTSIKDIKVGKPMAYQE